RREQRGDHHEAHLRPRGRRRRSERLLELRGRRGGDGEADGGLEAQCELIVYAAVLPAVARARALEPTTEACRCQMRSNASPLVLAFSSANSRASCFASATRILLSCIKALNTSGKRISSPTADCKFLRWLSTSSAEGSFGWLLAFSCGCCCSLATAAWTKASTGMSENRERVLAILFKSSTTAFLPWFANQLSTAGS